MAREARRPGRGIERTINHVHLWDLFDPGPEGVSEDDVRGLADKIAHTWRCSLQEQFPDRNGDVVVDLDEADYGPVLTLFTRQRDN